MSKLRSAHARLSSDQGFTIVELCMAMVVLVVGMMGAATGFNSARKLSLVSERHATMAHVAQREIEQLEGVSYSQIALATSPSHSGDSTSPDYYVTNGSPPALQWNRSSTTSQEQLFVASSGAVTHTKSWSEGNLSGQVFDYVTWTTDPNCSSQCPTSGQDYKRLIVAVTIGGGLQPNPVYVSSVIADPAAAPSGGVINGHTGNPLKNAATYCVTSSGSSVACTSPIDSGSPNVWFLHDFSSWTSGSPTPPSATHATHNTVDTASGGTCTTSTTSGCPQPDLMDANAPTGDTTTPCYIYSSDQSGTPTCARQLQPTTDTGCSQGNASFSTLSNNASEFWVTSPLSSSMTLTGEGGFSMWTETAGSANAVVTFCLAVYDLPNSVSNLLSSAPTYLGGASFTPDTDPATSSNWPTGPTATSFIFHFLANNNTYTVPSGHRLGVRIWESASPSTALAVLYDHPLYPAQLQLNSQ